MLKLLISIYIFGSVYCQSRMPSSRLPGHRLDKEKTEQEPLNEKNQNIDPVYAPDKCPENQLLYPGPKKDDWICDCGPGYIYYPPKDGCFAAYRQGPCKESEHLILKPGRPSAECAPNPCQEGFARYKGKCYEMGRPNGPCRPVIEGGGIFDVNEATLVVECVKGTDRLSLFSMPTKCAPGSKRDSNGNCRVIYN